MEETKVIKAGIWYTISNILIKGIAFITLPIFTRILSSNDLGDFSNILSWFNILAIVTTFEISSSISIARFDFKKELNEYISSSLVLGTIITAFFYIVILFFHEFFENLFSIDFITLNIMFTYLLVYPSVQMYLMKCQINYQYIPVIIVSALNAVLSSVCSIILILCMKNKLYGRILGYFIPLLIVSIVIYIKLIISGKNISRKYWKYAIKISFPLIWHLLAGYLLSSSDRIMIKKFISNDANALYTVPYTISMVISILWSSMNNAWSPWAYEQMEKKNYEELFKNSKPYTLFFLAIAFVFMLITPELLYIMGGKYYIQAKFVMPPVMVGYIFQFIYSLYVNIEFYWKKQKNIAIGTSIAAIINIVLNYLFIPKYGYIVAAYTTLIGYGFLLVIHYIFVMKLKCTYWYDTKFFIVISVISIAFCILVNLLYVYNVIRYIIITIIFLISLYFIIKNNKILCKYIKLILNH